LAPNPQRHENWFDLVTLQSVLSDLSHFIAVERLGPRVTKRVCWRGRTSEKKIALTFDDGPQPEFTPQLLKILDQHSVPATFFMVGRHVERHTALAKEVAASGHELGNHTYSHQMMFRLTDAVMADEIHRTHDLLANLNGAAPTYLRPPMGLFSRRVLDVVEQSGYRTVVGDVYPRDPHLPGREKILSRVLGRVMNGSIIILHDGGNTNHVDRSQTVWAVERLLPELLKRGFQFVTLSELLNGDSISRR